MTEQRISTGYKPHVWQLHVHARLKRFNVLVCHRRFGKTVMGVNQLGSSAIRCNKKAGRYAYIAPQLKQAKTVAWDYLKAFARTIPGSEVNESELRITLPNDAQIRVYGADNPDALRGIYLDGAVVDEVAQMRPEMWGEVLRPALADRKGWVLFIGTPKGIDYFHELYTNATADDEWYADSFSVDRTRGDLPWLSDEELAKARADQTEAQYRQEWLCDWMAASDNVLISLDLIEQGRKASHNASEVRLAPVILGVDVARYGGDRSAIIRRQGLVCYEPQIYRGIDNMELADRVAHQAREHNAQAIFIDAGRGEGVIDRLRQVGFKVMEVNFGGTPDGTTYRNKRVEMWDGIKKWLESGGQLPQCPELMRDLSTPLYSFDANDSKMMLESKDKMKERCGFSVDVGDSLALTFAMPVAPAGESAHYNTAGEGRSRRRDYNRSNPLERLRA